MDKRTALVARHPSRRIVRSSAPVPFRAPSSSAAIEACARPRPARGEAFDDERLQELAESIRAQGVLQPLLVRPRATGEFTLVAGERRWRAAQRAGLHEVPVVVRGGRRQRRARDGPGREPAARATSTRSRRRRRSGRCARRPGTTQDQIAQKVGKGRPAVTNALRLLRLPEPVLELLRAGALSAGQARAAGGARRSSATGRAGRAGGRPGSRHARSRLWWAPVCRVTSRGARQRRWTPTPSPPRNGSPARYAPQSRSGGVASPVPCACTSICEDELMRLYDHLLSGKETAR